MDQSIGSLLDGMMEKISRNIGKLDHALRELYDRVEILENQFKVLENKQKALEIRMDPPLLPDTKFIGKSPQNMDLNKKMTWGEYHEQKKKEQLNIPQLNK
jgi:hypothetical protein